MGRSTKVYVTTTPQTLIFALCVAMVCYTVIKVNKDKERK